MEIKRNNLIQVERHARALMTAHGVGRIEFAFDRGTRRIAACHMIQMRSGGQMGPVLVKKITLSKKWALVLPEAELHEIMLHEIAHALTHDAPRPHGPEFARKVVEMGGKATKRCFSPSVNIDGSPRSF